MAPMNDEAFRVVWIMMKGGIPCIQCGRTYTIEEYQDREDQWKKWFDEDGMEFDVCPSCVFDNTFRVENPDHVPDIGVTLGQDDHV